MRILLVHQYFLERNDSGGSRFNEMTNLWASQGHKVTVLSGMVHYATGKKGKKYKGKLFYKDLEFYPGVDVVRCHVSESYNLSFLGRLWAYFSFVFSSTYAGLFKVKGDYDIILVTSPPLFVGITALILSKIKRLPFVFEIRDLWPESAIDTGVLTNHIIIRLAFWFESHIDNHAEMINVLTPAFRDVLTKTKNVPKEKIMFIPNGSDFSLAESIHNDASFSAHEFKRQLGFENKFVITYVGAHGVANHLIQLIDVAEKLNGTKVIFQLIGAGMQKNDLIKEVKKRKLNNVIFREPVAKIEVFKYILASDVGTSVLKKADTFKTIYSNKTFDYMSCKKPILLAIDGVSRNLIEESECGIYVEPENTESIINGIKVLLSMSDKELLLMGRAGYEYSRKHFDREFLGNKYLDNILEVTKRAH